MKGRFYVKSHSSQLQGQNWVKIWSTCLVVIEYPLGAVQKLRWQDLDFFDHLTRGVNIFYGMNDDKMWTFLDHQPTSSCKRSLWTPPLENQSNLFFYEMECWT